MNQSQLQATIYCRPITENLNIPPTNHRPLLCQSGGWSEEILFIFNENVTDPMLRENSTSYCSSYSTLKGQSNEIFDLQCFPNSNLLGPLTNGLQYVQVWIRIR